MNACCCPQPANGYGTLPLGALLLLLFGIYEGLRALVHWWVFDVWQPFLCTALWITLWTAVSLIGLALVVLIIVAAVRLRRLYLRRHRGTGGPVLFIVSATSSAVGSVDADVIQGVPVFPALEAGLPDGLTVDEFLARTGGSLAHDPSLAERRDNQ